MSMLMHARNTVAGILMSLGVLSLAVSGAPAARAETSSDFASDVQKSIATAAPDAARSAASAIPSGEYPSSWDEFGSNALVDGSRSSSDIRKDLLDDIITDLRAQLAYNQEDERYLRIRHSSPEEVVAAEDAGGNDLSPSNYIDPNPSLEANPDVNPSALDVPLDTVDTAAVDAAEYSAPSDATISDGVTPTAPESLTPDGGEWGPSDINVFETILNADTVTEPPAEPPAESSTQSNPAPETVPASTDTPPPSTDSSPPETPAN